MRPRINKKKPRRFGTILRKRVCRFCTGHIKTIDYKDVKMLESFVRERGKIISSRSNGNCARHQRAVTDAIKKARFISLVPYVRY